MSVDKKATPRPWEVGWDRGITGPTATLLPYREGGYLKIWVGEEQVDPDADGCGDYFELITSPFDDGRASSIVAFLPRKPRKLGEEPRTEADAALIVAAVNSFEKARELARLIQELHKRGCGYTTDDWAELGRLSSEALRLMGESDG